MKLRLIFLAGILILTSASAALSQAKDDDLKWKEFSSKEGAFAISFPGDPKTETKDIETAVGKAHTVNISMSIDGTQLGVMYSDSAGGANKTEKEIRERYDKLRDGLIGKPGHELIFDRDAVINGKLGREVGFWSDQSHVMVIKIFIIGDRLYQVIQTRKMVFGPADQQALTMMARFSNSFRLLPN